MKLSHVLILALSHLITVGAVIWLCESKQQLAMDNVALANSGSELLAELRTARSALDDKFGDAVAKRQKKLVQAKFSPPVRKK